MTARRTLVAILVSLVVVFAGASTLTVYVVWDRLLADVDAELRDGVDSISAAITEFRIDLDAAEAIDVGGDASRQALIIVDGRDEVVFVPAGSRASPLPRPDLSASAIVARAGEPFRVDSVDGSVDYRVLTEQLDDGRYLALAQPLDGVRDTLTALGRSLLVTLLAVVAALGVVFWLLLRASLRPYNDMIATAGAIADGEWDRRAAATSRVPALERLGGALNSMLDQVQRSFVAKDEAETRLRQFVADASHELRTPLTSISGYSELYLSGAATDDASVTKQMTRINDEAERLGRMVDDLTRLARLDESRPMHVGDVDLVSLVADVASDSRVAHPDAELSVTGGATPVVVRGDADAIRQVIVNLVSNARQHTPAETRVTLGVEAVDGFATVTVSDDGPGMDAETAAHVFDRFYRADRSRSRAQGHSGLGLSIAAAIVAAHDGHIDVETAPGQGATFVVALPLAADHGRG